MVVWMNLNECTRGAAPTPAYSQLEGLSQSKLPSNFNSNYGTPSIQLRNIMDQNIKKSKQA